ncbi:MAG: hypothetical protein QOH95_741 [Gaiellaceae bacterium]|jgi:hypothetical protein|nr:hypothetical protein [Gaiellaceae bacterium]
MSDKEELGQDELDEQQTDVLPERTAMSVIRTMPIDHPLPPVLPTEPETLE